MAEESSPTLATVETDLPDFATFVEKSNDHLLRGFRRKTADPDSPATLRLGGLRQTPVFADTVRCNGLILRVVQADGHTLDGGSCQLHGLVNVLRLQELDVSKLPVFELVHSQTQHLYLTTLGLKEIDQVLFTGIDGYVAHPESVAIWRLDTFWSISPAARRLGLGP